MCLVQLMDFEVQLVTGESTPKKARGERRYGCGSSVGCFTSFCFRHKDHTQMCFCDQQVSFQAQRLRGLMVQYGYACPGCRHLYTDSRCGVCGEPRCISADGRPCAAAPGCECQRRGNSVRRFDLRHGQRVGKEHYTIARELGPESLTPEGMTALAQARPDLLARLRGLINPVLHSFCSKCHVSGAWPCMTCGVIICMGCVTSGYVPPGNRGPFAQQGQALSDVVLEVRAKLTSARALSEHRTCECGAKCSENLGHAGHSELKQRKMDSLSCNLCSGPLEPADLETASCEACGVVICSRCIPLPPGHTRTTFCFCVGPGGRSGS